MELIKVGTDIEFVLTIDGRPISSLNFISGTKEKPEKMRCMSSHYKWMCDNVLLEINVPPVDIHKKNAINKMDNNIKKAIDYVQNHIPINVRCCAIAGAVYDSKDLNNKIAQTLGCQSDFNVYTKRPNPRPIINSNFRGCGLHVHISYKNHNRSDTEKLMKLFDILISSALIYSTNEELKRRNYYGKAGAFRFTPYGFEARTLPSNAIDDWDYIIKMLLWIEKAYNYITEEDINLFSEDAIKNINDCTLNLVAADFITHMASKHEELSTKKKEESAYKKISNYYIGNDLIMNDSFTAPAISLEHMHNENMAEDRLNIVRFRNDEIRMLYDKRRNNQAYFILSDSIVERIYEKYNANFIATELRNALLEYLEYCDSCITDGYDITDNDTIDILNI